MFIGLPLDRRAHAILICRLLADRVEDGEVSLRSIGELARELAEHLLDESPDDQPLTMTGARFRVIEGGRN